MPRTSVGYRTPAPAHREKPRTQTQTAVDSRARSDRTARSNKHPSRIQKRERVTRNLPCADLMGLGSPDPAPYCGGFNPPTEHSHTAPATARPSLWWSGLLPRAPRRTRPGVSCTLSTPAHARSVGFPLSSLSQLSHASPSSMLPSSSSIESASQSTGGTGRCRQPVARIVRPAYTLPAPRHRRHRRRASYAATPKGRGPC
jgi:hypothetical protein